MRGEIGGLIVGIVVYGHDLGSVKGNRFEPRCDRDSPPLRISMGDKRML